MPTTHGVDAVPRSVVSDPDDEQLFDRAFRAAVESPMVWWPRFILSHCCASCLGLEHFYCFFWPIFCITTTSYQRADLVMDPQRTHLPGNLHVARFGRGNIADYQFVDFLYRGMT